MTDSTDISVSLFTMRWREDDGKNKQFSTFSTEVIWDDVKSSKKKRMLSNTSRFLPQIENSCRWRYQDLWMEMFEQKAWLEQKKVDQEMREGKKNGRRQISIKDTWIWFLSLFFDLREDSQRGSHSLLPDNGFTQANTSFSSRFAYVMHMLHLCGWSGTTDKKNLEENRVTEYICFFRLE